jgi:hypothetical protein
VCGNCCVFHCLLQTVFLILHRLDNSVPCGHPCCYLQQTDYSFLLLSITEPLLLNGESGAPVFTQTKLDGCYMMDSMKRNQCGVS